MIGIISVSVAFKSNKKGHVQNYLDAAMVDEVFYEKLVELDAWLYKMNEEDAASFYRK